ncbi:heme exporter protein CcmD [Thalassotalea litorea]|uniref:Heme exporter protein D n=1 Tax=Thalassotalea litorea TaxID=2020715 RepID=A0A5R9IHN5_9GAMM|nr:heme exporter protein CcmD [Thalassotalea litorea]TLU64802.1 heme exporter protein CcmD [Thalassotalea litorea]
MTFESFSEFLTMGKHGFYIWLSYGCTLVILLALGINSMRQPKVQLEKIRQRLKREQQLKAYQQKKAEGQNQQQTSTDSGEVV